MNADEKENPKLKESVAKDDCLTVQWFIIVGSLIAVFVCPIVTYLFYMISKVEDKCRADHDTLIELRVVTKGLEQDYIKLEERFETLKQKRK